jgi:hypothetical protein
MQDVSCVTAMLCYCDANSPPRAAQHITQAISNVDRDMLQRMWEGLTLPLEYAEGIQDETWYTAQFVQAFCFIAPFVQEFWCYWDILYFRKLNLTTDFGSLCTCILVYSVHVFWFILYIYYGSFCTCILVHSVHVFWFTLYRYFGSLCTCILVHSVHVFWFILYMYFGSLCTCILVHSVHVFRLALYMYFGPLCRCILVHSVHVFRFTLCMYFPTVLTRRVQTLESSSKQ